MKRSVDSLEKIEIIQQDNSVGAGSLLPPSRLCSSAIEKGQVWVRTKQDVTVKHKQKRSTQSRRKKHEMSQPGTSQSETLLTDAGRKQSRAKSTNTSQSSTRSSKSCRVTSFNLQPEFIPRQDSICWTTDELVESGVFTAEELKEGSENSTKKVRRLVAIVGISLTLLSFFMVAASLYFGRKIDDLVEKNSPERMFRIQDTTGNTTSTLLVSSISPTSRSRLH